MDFLTKDSAMPVYLVFPRFLLDSDLGETAKLLYIVLLDRARLSQQDARWRDEQGRVFLYYTIQDLGRTLHKGKSAIHEALLALENAGLIVREHQGARKANRIFIKCLTSGKTDTHRPEKRTYDLRNSGYMTSGKPDTSNNYRVKTSYQKYPCYDLRNYDCSEDESL
jgi:hypothetical protein